MGFGQAEDYLLLYRRSAFCSRHSIVELFSNLLILTTLVRRGARWII